MKSHLRQHTVNLKCKLDQTKELSSPSSLFPTAASQLFPEVGHEGDLICDWLLQLSHQLLVKLCDDKTDFCDLGILSNYLSNMCKSVVNTAPCRTPCRHPQQPSSPHRVCGGPWNRVSHMVARAPELRFKNVKIPVIFLHFSILSATVSPIAIGSPTVTVSKRNKCLTFYLAWLTVKYWVWLCVKVLTGWEAYKIL